MLSKALSETYKHQPNDPVAFFSKFLLNHCNVKELHKNVKFTVIITVFRILRGTNKSGNFESKTSTVPMPKKPKHLRKKLQKKQKQNELSLFFMHLTRVRTSMTTYKI